MKEKITTERGWEKTCFKYLTKKEVTWLGEPDAWKSFPMV